MNDCDEKIAELRKRAMETLESKRPSMEKMPVDDVRKLVEELQIHQIELEIQNEELRSVHYELEQSRKKYSDLYDSAPVGYLTLSEEGRIVEANLTAAKQLGMARSILIGKPFNLCVAENDRERLHLYWENVLKTRQPQTCEMKLNGSSRLNRYVRLDSKYILDSDDQAGAAGGIIAVMVDITDRKRAENALMVSEERFRLAFENVNIGMCLVDTQGLIFKANHQMCETLGYDRNQFEGMTVYDITAPDHKEVSLTFLRRATSAEIDHSESEHCYIHKKGHLIWGRVGASLVRDDAGAPLYLVVHAQDITKRKQAEAALQEAHEQLKGIIEFLPDAICVVDRAGKVIAWNRASEEMSGVRKEKMIGMGDYAHAVPFYGEARPVLIDLAMNSNDKHIDLYDCIERQNKLLSGEVFVPNAYGGKGAFLWAKASPLFDKSGDLIGAIEVIRDITDLKEIESRLLKREVDLEEKAHQLEEINTALKVLLRRREEDKKELEESLLTNVEESILPFLEKLKKTRLDENQKTYLAIVESQLGEIVSPFLKSLSSRFTNLTPMEIKVAKFIKEGKSSKEIAEILGVAEKTILTHRSNLRAKLGLRNEKTNLCSHLMSLT